MGWKSLEAGSPDYIEMHIEGDLDPDSLRYIRDSGLPVPSSPAGGDKSARSLFLSGGMDGDREMLSVARNSPDPDNDTSKSSLKRMWKGLWVIVVCSNYFYLQPENYGKQCMR